MELSRSIKRIVLLGLVSAVVLGACARATPTPTKDTSTPATSPAALPTTPATLRTTPATTAAPYGDLRIGVTSFDLETFDLIRGGPSSIGTMGAPILDQLITLDGAKLTPGVAESWELAPDGLSWVFRIRKGIKFHDGESLTADDVKFSFEKYAAPEARLGMVRDAVSRVEKVDDYTVRVYTKGPQPYLPAFVTYYTPAYGAILPKQYRDLANWERNPIGSGPFKFVRHVKGDMVQYEANTDYWGQVPAFKNLSVMLIPEESTRVAMLKTGGLDIADVGLDRGREVSASGFKVSILGHAQTYVMLIGAYNPGSERLPIADVRVRKALSLAINRDEINRTFLYGQGSAPMPAHMPVEAALDLDIPYWLDRAAKDYALYDPEKARKLLAEAGYAQGLDIKLYENLLSGAAFLSQVAQIAAGYWLKIGVKAEIVPSEWGTVRGMANIIKAPSSPVRGNAVLMRVGGRPTTSEIFDTYVSPKGTVALLGESWPEVTTLITSIAQELDVNKRRLIVAGIVQRWADSYISLPIGGIPQMAALGPKVDVDFNNPSLATPQYAFRAKHR